MQVRAEIVLFCVREHDELHAGSSLVVMELVFAGAVGQEGSVVPSEFLDHVPEREDETEDQLLVIGVRIGLAHSGLAIAGYAGPRLRARGLATGGGGPGSPSSAVDAFSWGDG